MLLYRINDNLSSNDLPVLPFISFSDSINVARLPTISIDNVEFLWNNVKQLTFVLHYSSGNVYYFLIEDTLPNTAKYRRMRLEVGYDIQDHRCDFYSRVLFTRFIDRLSRRRCARGYLNAVIADIPFPPEDIQYHQQLIEKLRINHVYDIFDMPFLQQILQQSQDLVDAEKRYRPNEIGYEEAKEQFHETMRLSSEMVGMGINASHSQKNLFPTDSK